VWKSTKKAAGNNCNPTQRPSTIRACVTPDLPKCEKIDPYDEHKSKWGLEQQSNDLESKALIAKNDNDYENKQTPDPIASQRPQIQRLTSWRGWQTYNLEMPSHLRRLASVKKL
jgi:hypothetical protein